jgi:hypothetical protein
MPRAVAAIRDRGGAEPYSDTNAAMTLERSLQPAPAAGVVPAAGESFEWTADGKSLDMRASDGTTTRIGPGAAAPIKLAADFSTPLSLTLQNVPGMSFALAVGEVKTFDAIVLFSSNATANGIKLALAGPAIGSGTAMYVLETQLTDTTFDVKSIRGWSTAHAATGSVAAANTVYLARIRGAVRNGPTAGTVQLQVAPELATNTVTVHAGSSLTAA